LFLTQLAVDHTTDDLTNDIYCLLLILKLKMVKFNVHKTFNIVKLEI